MGSTPSSASHTFGVAERLKGKKHFAEIFTKGHSIHRPPLTLIYREMRFHLPVSARTAFTVPKRKFKKATDRNMLKRRMKEAFRQHKHGLYDTLTKNKKQAGIVFVYTGKEAVPYSEISHILILLLQDLIKQVSPADV